MTRPSTTGKARIQVSLGPPAARVPGRPRCFAWWRARARGLTARSTRARSAGDMEPVTRKVAMSDHLPAGVDGPGGVRERRRWARGLDRGRRARAPSEALVDEAVELVARHAEA